MCAESGGFSLHAGAWVAARDRERLEKLCRYAGRPAVAESRLVELGGGRIGYSMKKRWRDGTTAVVMTQGVLMERLCALVPRPRKHLVTYHGVLAPASGLRSHWSNRYARVEIAWSTHDLGGVIDLDVAMLRAFDALARTNGARPAGQSEP